MISISNNTTTLSLSLKGESTMNKILNAKELCNKLSISTTFFYKMKKAGMPYHQLCSNSRAYYILDEVEDWLSEAGFHQETKWTK